MRDRRLLAALFGVLALALALVPSEADAQPDDEPPGRIELVIFYGEGCPYCARELAFLADLQVREPLLDVIVYEVWNDEQNRELFRTTAASHGTEPQAVPTTFLGDSMWVGFDSTVQRQIEAAVVALAAGQTPSVEERSTVDVPFVGTVDVGGSSLVAATLLIGFVDGVNPCSLWVVRASGAVALFVLYLLVFLVDELVIFGIAVVTLRSAKLQERHGKALQLASGMLMVALAVTMLFAPHLLESISGTSIVFGFAALFVAAALALDHLGSIRRAPCA